MGQMKKYSQFLKELPSNTVVFAFGRFNPPTTGHELLVKAVKKLAVANKADHAIYASKSQDAKKNPLSVEKKVHYLKLMFPNTNFVAANPTERTFIEAAKALNKKYKNLIMVAGSDRIPEYERILNTYNGKDFHYDTVQVISAGERDPDADDATGMSASKMRAVATKGDYSQFKKGLPSTMREIDGRRLMNDVRQGMGLEPIKEHLNLVKDQLREQYFRGEIFNIGDIVESAGVQYQIVKRGSNHLLLKEESGKLVSKWIQDVSLVEDVSTGYAPQEISFGGYTTKNLHHSEDAAKAFQDTIARHGKEKPAAVLHALMATDTYMGLSDLHLNQGKQPTETEKEQWVKSHEHAKQHLDELGEFLHHRDYWDNHQHEMEDMLSNYKEEGQSEMNEELTDKTLKSQDKIKVARIIATMLGIDNAETSANPDQLVNLALRKVRTKSLNPEALSILNKMLELAREVGIKVDTTAIPTKLKESEVINKSSTYNAAKDRLRYKDFAKLSKMNKGVAEEDETDDVGDVAHVDADAHDRIKATEPHRIVGQSITHPLEDSSDRRQKIQYVSEEQLDEISQKLAGNYYAKVTQQHIKKVGGVRHNMYDRIEKDMGKQRKAGVDRALDRVMGNRKTNEELVVEGAYEKAEENKRSAEAAKKQGDMFAHHLHMADHHDNMAEWHASKGRHGEADRHAEKSEQHHEKAMALKEETTPYWKKSSWIKKMSQAAKQERLAREKKEAEQKKQVKEETGLSEGQTDDWKKVQSMDKGSVLQGKEGARKRLAYLQAVHAHHKKYGNDTKKVRKDIENLNRSRLAEEADEIVDEALRDACWKGYEAVGMKEKNGKKVPNCVPVKEENEVCPICGEEECTCEKDDEQLGAHNAKGFDPFFAEEADDEVEDISDEELEGMADSIKDIEDVIDAYDDDELAIVDDETGEEIEDDADEKMNEAALMEVLSRMERMKAKVRIARSKAKRERATKIALRTYSSTDKINKRARRLAVQLMKKRLLRGRDISKVSVGEKERIERTIEKRKKAIGRLAMRLASRVRGIEKARMAHQKFTKGAPNVSV